MFLLLLMEATHWFAEPLDLTVTLCRLDPYVKVHLICDGRRLKKRKTTTKKSTLNPVYNEAIIFDIPPENVEQVSLSIMVMDYDRWVERPSHAC